jgi:two-component system sensor histidine kinase UhpB
LEGGVFDSWLEVASASPWTYALVFAAAALDVFVPLVPSETLLVSAAALATNGDLALSGVVAVAAAGAIIGDNAAYAAGRALGPRAEHRLRRGKLGRRARWANRQLAERGATVILIARFVPGGRTAAMLTAGLLGMPWRRFFLYDALAGVIWAVYGGAIGSLGGAAFEDEPWKALVLALGVAFALALLAERVRHLRRSPARMPLFWRVFLANAAILACGILVLTIAPLSTHAELPKIVDLVVGLALMVIVNWFALRPLFRPLEQLADRMDDADVLRGATRVPVRSTGEVGALERAYNEMMDRLELERRDAAARALHAQEEERRRIARGLHDEVGQTMTGVLFQLQRLARNAPPEQEEALADTQDAVRTSLEEVRRIAQELRPEALDHLGLASALTTLSRRFSDRTGIAVRREFERDLPELAPEVELVVYRVAQESLTNAARHSGADEITLELGDDGDGVLLRVSDNGRGLNGHAEGGGLRGIREHALVVGGKVAIRSRPRGGVEVRLHVPAGAAP